MCYTYLVPDNQKLLLGLVSLGLHIFIIRTINVFLIKSIRFLIPAFFRDDKMSVMFGVTHQEFYKLHDEYVRPFLATPGPGSGRRQEIDVYIINYLLLDCRKLHRLTVDSLLALFLRKLREGTDDR